MIPFHHPAIPWYSRILSDKQCIAAKISNMTAGFAFPRNISSRVLWKLTGVDSCFQLWPNNIDFYLQILEREQPSRILGLGSYSGIDQDKIRIETKCSNKFHNDFVIGNKLIKQNINPFLKPGKNSKYSQGIGSSHCNRICWKITEFINNKKLKSGTSQIYIKLLDFMK